MRWSLFVAFLVTIVLIGGSVAYNRIEDHRETCAVVDGLVSSYQQTPGSSVAGRQRAEDWLALQGSLHC